ncbi:unnamed protein product [Leuciscus chuanchicus]
MSSLQQRAEQIYRNLEDIDQLTEFVQKHIENAVQIHHELVLQSADFCVDGDTRVVASPASAPRRSLLEQPKNSTLTVQQLHVLCAQLSKTAPTGQTQRYYTEVELWFPSERDVPVPDDPTEPLPYDRLANLKKCFFSLFASSHSSPLMLDYLSLLLYFCGHPEPAQGFTRALGLVIGHTLHYKHTGPLTQSVPYIEGAGVEADKEEERGVEPDEEEERGEELDEVGVSVDDVLRVLSRGDDHVSSHLNRFQPNHRSRDEFREELLKVFKELGFKGEEKIDFSTLSQHPFLQDLIEGSSQYLLPVSITHKHVISHTYYNTAQW